MYTDRKKLLFAFTQCTFPCFFIMNSFLLLLNTHSCHLYICFIILPLFSLFFCDYRQTIRIRNIICLKIKYNKFPIFYPFSFGYSLFFSDACFSNTNIGILMPFYSGVVFIKKMQEFVYKITVLIESVIEFSDNSYVR